MSNFTEQDGIPVTPLQEGMIFHSLSHPDSGVDVEHVIIDINESLDIEKLLEAWNGVIAHRKELRTDYRWKGLANPVSHINDFFEIPYSVLDWTNSEATEFESKFDSLKRKDREVGYELDSGPPMRLYVIKLEADRFVILWSFHHIILDGRSFPIILSEVFDGYDSQEIAVLESPREFSDYVNVLFTRDYTNARNYWKEKFKDYESPSSIPQLLDTTSNKHNTKSKYDSVELLLSKELTDQLKVVALEQSVSMNTLVQSAWAIILHHYSQQNLVVFGSTRAIRHVMPHAKEIVGLLINTVPFKVQLSDSLTVTELLGSVYKNQFELRSVETSPLTIIQECVSPGAHTLFDSLVMYDDKTLDERMHELPQSQPDSRTFHYEGQTNYPISLIAYGGVRLSLRIEFLSKKYNINRCAQILNQLENILQGITKKPEEIAVRLPYLTEYEVGKFDQWNDSSRPYTLDTTLHELFEAQVELSPDKIAVCFEGRSLTFSQFNCKANKLAHYLRSMGVEPDDLIGVLADRSIEMLVGIYAILKAGGAYVPFDPAFPSERLHYVVEDSGVDLILADNSLLPKLPRTDAKIIDLNSSTEWEKYPDSNQDSVSESSNLAYMLYTSGSTGKPKGVMNEHRGIVNRLLWMQEAFQLNETDKVLQKTPYTFDVSIWELFWPLQVGAQLVIAKPEGHKDPDYLISTIAENHITTMHFVPSMLQLFIEDPNLYKSDSIKRIICSGEALPKSLQDKLFKILPNSELHNLYGPTEAAIDVTWWACDRKSDLSHVPIGRTIANTQIHILDNNLNSLPIGVAGELHIAGVQVARGYKNRESLTAEKFINNPFDASYKMYKTGDLARYMPDGNIEYLGRLDFQVKIRGLRIELGEIESVLTSHPAVNEAVVTAIKAPSGDDQIVAYVVGLSSIDTNLLIVYCRESLSDYMIPTEWIVLDSFPLNSSGKVNRKSLPIPDFSSASHKHTSTKPNSEVEKKILLVWQEILGKQELSTSATFFDLGGNSLLLIRLSNKLAELFNRKVQVQDLLRESTIIRQAVLLSRSETDSDANVIRATEQARKQKSARNRRRRPSV